MSRFGEEQDPLFRRINSSISFDWRLAPFDIEQSKAHARVLAKLDLNNRVQIALSVHDAGLLEPTEEPGPDGH